jgi:1-acyl-sn-glycerol-3-phosphate acyltransferase
VTTAAPAPAVAAHSWMPVSPCGESCLTAAAPAVALPRRVLRVCAAIVVVLGALLLAPALLVLGQRLRDRLLRSVFGGVLHAFGVRLVVHGDADLRTSPAGRGALVVNNHISWMDIVAVNAVRPMRALGKKEIASWPVLGGLVSRAGTIFLDRERLSTLPATMAELACALRGGSLVNVTPEGTTWCGLGSGRFTTAAFQAAIDGGVPVRPVALRYRLADGRETPQPSFIGPESLIDSVRRVARLRGLVLEVFVCPEIAPGRATDRRGLAALAQSAVDAALDHDRVFAFPTPDLALPAPELNVRGPDLVSGEARNAKSGAGHGITAVATSSSLAAGSKSSATPSSATAG